jgi:hypothetical protein
MPPDGACMTTAWRTFVTFDQTPLLGKKPAHDLEHLYNISITLLVGLSIQLGPVLANLTLEAALFAMYQ